MSEESPPPTPVLSKAEMSQPARQSVRRIDQCTHSQVTRVWDKYDCFKCTVCHRASTFGYLYRCTQDTQGVLPDSDFVDVEDGLKDVQINSRPTTGSHSSFAANSIFPSFPTTTTMSTKLSLDLDDENLFDKLAARNPDLLILKEPEVSKCLVVTNPEPTTSCEFKVCPACRPVYRDRAWQSMDTVLSESTKLPSQFEVDNRPFSDIQALAKMDYTRQRFYANVPQTMIGETSDQSSSSHSRKSSRAISKDDIEIANGSKKSKEHPLKQDMNNSPLNVQTSGYDADTEQHEDVTHTSTDVTCSSKKPKRPGFLRNLVQSKSFLLKPRNPNSLLNNSLNYKGLSNSTLIVDQDKKEEHVARSLTKGRFFID